jgi:hypothetical protein
MVEEDGAKRAALNGWTQVASNFTCTDPAILPKVDFIQKGNIISAPIIPATWAGALKCGLRKIKRP